MQIIADSAIGLIFKNKRDRKVINVDPKVREREREVEVHPHVNQKRGRGREEEEESEELERSEY